MNIDRDRAVPPREGRVDDAADGRYASLGEFYAEDQRRERSPEADFGVFWRDESGWPAWRISWVQATGEVYAAAMIDGAAEVLGVIAGDLTARLRYEPVEQALEGWRERCGQPRSLGWARDRMAAHLEQQPVGEIDRTPDEAEVTRGREDRLGLGLEL